MLNDQGDILATRVVEILIEVGDQLGNTNPGIATAEETEGVIKADAIELEAIQPIDAYIADKLLNALVLVVKVFKEAATCEGTNKPKLIS